MTDDGSRTPSVGSPLPNVIVSCESEELIHSRVFHRARFENRNPTGVWPTGTNFTRLTTVHRASFSSSMANRMPMQLRGPNPNGMYAYGFRLCLFSTAQLLVHNIRGLG